MATLLPITPPVSNAYMTEIVPFYGANNTLYLLNLWTVGLGGTNVPLQVLGYNSQTNSFTDVTSSIFSGAIPSTDNPRNVTIADFNGDGLSDIMIANQGLDASPWPGTSDTLLLSTPTGHLADASGNLPQTLAYTHDLSSGKIDQAGDVGVFMNNIYSQPNTAPYYLIGSGNGTLTNKSNTFLPANLHSTYPTYTSSALVDVNGDGRADLILGAEDQTQGSSLVYINPGNGDFSHLTPIALPASPLPATQGLYNSTPTGPTILDIEPIHIASSTYNDLVVVSTNGDYQGYAIQILINDGTGHFTDQTATRLLGAPSEVVYSTGQPWVVRSFITDLNGDGAPDIITEGANGTPSQVFLNDGSGHFNLAMSLTSAPSNVGTTQIFGVATLGGTPNLIEMNQSGETNFQFVPFASLPVVTDHTANQAWYYSEAVSLTLPSDTFKDPGGQLLTYTASELDGASLHSWLLFNPNTLTFSGTVPSGAQPFTLTVTATDPSGFLVQDNFTVSIGSLIDTLTPGQQLELIYLGYFNRSADGGGFTFWEGQNVSAQAGGQSAAVALTNIANSFTPQAETIALYPFLSNPHPNYSDPTVQAGLTTFVQNVYGNLFGHTADSGGSAYWTGQIESGAVGLGAAVLVIANGAQASDAIILQNKIAVALDFTTLTNAANIPTTSALIAEAKTVLAGVDGTSLNDASVTAAEALIAPWIASHPHGALVAVIGSALAAVHAGLA